MKAQQLKKDFERYSKSSEGKLIARAYNSFANFLNMKITLSHNILSLEKISRIVLTIEIGLEIYLKLLKKQSSLKEEKQHLLDLLNNELNKNKREILKSCIIEIDILLQKIESKINEVLKFLKILEKKHGSINVLKKKLSDLKLEVENSKSIIQHDFIKTSLVRLNEKNI